MRAVGGLNAAGDGAALPVLGLRARVAPRPDPGRAAAREGKRVLIAGPHRLDGVRVLGGAQPGSRALFPLTPVSTAAGWAAVGANRAKREGRPVGRCACQGDARSD